MAAATIGLMAAPAPADAWCNGHACDPVAGNGYGTHDWIIDQAVRVFDGHVPDWLDVAVARLASDDPDTLFWRTNEHVYREGGHGRGAIHQIVEWYDQAAHHLRVGEAHAASIDVGRLAHYVADLLPYHTAEAAKYLDGEHHRYELLVDGLTTGASDMPEWQTRDRTVSAVPDVRTMAIRTAAYTRARFAALHAAFVAPHAAFAGDQTTLDATVRAITGDVLKRLSRDLADMIHSIGLNVGRAARPATLVVRRRSSQPTRTEVQVFTIKVTDAHGRVIEGAQVDVWFPASAEVPSTARRPDAPHAFRAYTMPDGVATAKASIDLSRHGAKQTVYITVTSRGQTITAKTWYVAR